MADHADKQQASPKAAPQGQTDPLALPEQGYSEGREVTPTALAGAITNPSSKTLTPSVVHHLQQTHGNHFVQRLIAKSKPVLPKPHITKVTSQKLQRASFNVGTTTIQVDYSGLPSITPAQVETSIESSFTSWSGLPASTIHASLTALNQNQQRYVLFGLDLLIDNATPSLTKDRAMQRIIAHAPLSAAAPLSGSVNFEFEREVLRVSGWFEAALPAGLTAPTGANLAALQGLYNPPPAPTAPPGGVLDTARLQAELPPALTSLLNNIDPAKWSATGTTSLNTLQTIADAIQAEAQVLFTPYANTAMSNANSTGWRYSANLVSVTATVPTQAQRINYLTNRANIVGGNSQAGPSIFSRVNYDSSRPADQTELSNIVTQMETQSAIQGVVNRLIQHTGRTSRAINQVGISTEYNAGAETECQARWRTIGTLSHELVHVLVNPDFAAKATTVGFEQVIREGFTEVLGVQLHRHLVQKAGNDATFRGQMEAGLSGSPCASIPAATIGYGQAGANAENIRSRVGDANFRAAYFLGATRLVGL